MTRETLHETHIDTPTHTESPPCGGEQFFDLIVKRLAYIQHSFGIIVISMKNSAAKRHFESIKQLLSSLSLLLFSDTRLFSLFDFFFRLFSFATAKHTLTHFIQLKHRKMRIHIWQHYQNPATKLI